MKRAWIMHDDRRLEELPGTVVDDDSITWPLGLPTKGASESVHYLASTDFYRRHDVVPNEAAVFLRDSETNKVVPPSVVQRIRKLLGKGGGAA